MKGIFLLLVLQLVFFAYCSAHSGGSEQLLVKTGDTTTRVLDISIAANSCLKGLTNVSILAFTIHNNTLFIINEDKLVEINLQNGGISLNKVVTNFLQKLPKDTNYVSEIRVAEDGYYLTVFFNLYHITASGVVTQVHTMSRFLEDVYVVNDNLIVGNMDSVELIRKSGKRLYAWPISNRVSNGYIKGEKGLYHSGTGEDSTFEFQANGGNSLLINRYPPLSDLTRIKEPFLSYVSDKYFMVFPYRNRNVVYAIKKDQNKPEVYKTIAVKGVNLTPSYSQMQNEEGYPNIKISYWNNVYYILSVIKGKLKVLSFTV